MQSSNRSRRIFLIAAAGIIMVLGSALIFTLRQAASAPDSGPGTAHSRDAGNASNNSSNSWWGFATDDADDLAAPENLDERDRLPGDQDDRVFQEAPSSPVDLVDLRREMPDNLYWSRAVPTEEPKELKARAKAAAERNALYGKVLSNTASESEIRAFYADKLQQSKDYAAFVQRLLEKHRDELSERDLGLFGLALELHTARAAEIPREEADALARRAEHVKERSAWLAQQGR